MHKLSKKYIFLLSEKLGHQFKTEQLLLEALTHRSHNRQNNERMEFLGDAILSFIISDWLFENFAVSEGELTRIRASLVCKDSLAKIAKQLELGPYIRLGIGELKTGGHQRDSILADCLEAIIGAIFLDSGIKAAKICVLTWFKEQLSEITTTTINKDPKTLLQEYLQSKKYAIPIYDLYDVQGSDHKQVFFITCKIDLLAEPVKASGVSRKKAEQKCAEQILAILKQKNE